jgi:predicted dehydrogenase
MLRRTFLAATGFAATQARLAAQKEPIGIGLLGASHSHAEGKLRVIRDSADWTILGICEDDPKIRQQLTSQGIPLMTREQLLQHPGIRVIAVESPVRDHAKDGLAVLRAGKHLHLEKAPSDHYADFQKVVSLSQERRLLLQVGYMWRYHPGIGKALEAAHQGWLGDIYLVKASIGNRLEAERRPEWGEFAGGVMFELGGHVIDPLVRLLGKPRKITPALHTDGAFKDSFRDNIAAIFEWDRAMGVVQATTLQPDSSRYRAIEIYGTNGAAIVNPIEPPKLTINLAKAQGPYSAGVQQIPMPDYKRYVADFVELAAVVRGDSKLRVTGEEDLLVQDALLRASGMA